MAQININEISQNYTYSIGNTSFCTVALPITACWGPGFEDPAAVGSDIDTVLENTAWQKFSANQSGLEKFVSTFRGPASNYRAVKDYSYHMAMTLLTAGYDVLACRLCPGTHAEVTLTDTVSNGTLTLKAKHPGTFGNSLLATLVKMPNRNYWNLVTYIVDDSGVRTAAENKIFVFEVDNSSDSIYHISEIESNFFTFTLSGDIKDATATFTDADKGVQLTGGTDKAADGEAADMMADAIKLATARYKATSSDSTEYLQALNTLKDSTPSVSTASNIRYMEWLYTNVLSVYDLLKDKLAYNPNRVISPGWDDQNITAIDGTIPKKISAVSPIHVKLMEIAVSSRCATACIDIPKSCPRSAVYNDTDDATGYAQLLARYVPTTNTEGSLYQTHSALFAPWGQYTYTGMSRMTTASPSFLYLMISRAMLKNQSVQYEWMQPSNRTHSLNIGKLDYVVPKKLMDVWQSAEGVGVNIITQIPDLGTSVWGNSTLYEVPPATYQALSNLSTRLLMNAVKNVVYRVGVSITYQYNNDEAYSRFYAGVSPILDSMKNVGAIEDYKMEMAADINGLDSVNANAIIGKIYLVINGVIDNITVDLIALPQGTDLSQY